MVSERWLGGMLTNFSNDQEECKAITEYREARDYGTFEKITKKERLFLTRELTAKKILEGVETMAKLPGAVFVVDIKKEDIAVKEAKRLNIPVFAMVDTTGPGSYRLCYPGK